MDMEVEIEVEVEMEKKRKKRSINRLLEAKTFCKSLYKIEFEFT